ncbi:rhodanese-like domain-containing protein [Conchiformibius kuhniae]|uniref:Rhodanese-like domain-containing protein n=1 Tax=Conchiformibius kuhniae TaxID=211502 RepID=A0A8T9MTB8_9NEIS|nr:rhodanese-like domain-containing protein [Conchiformibius kuhniae]UOP04334.1 rhodanese-like domain-containing protein [Conchiformibius kuhniae]
MKHCLCVLLTLLAAACGAAEPSAVPASAAAVPARTGILIDVRSAEEFAAGHLNHAVNIPHDQIARHIAALTDNRDTEILLYCRSGRRSGLAQQTLHNMGYRNVRNLGAYDDLKTH